MSRPRAMTRLEHFLERRRFAPLLGGVVIGSYAESVDLYREVVYSLLAFSLLVDLFLWWVSRERSE